MPKITKKICLDVPHDPLILLHSVINKTGLILFEWIFGQPNEDLKTSGRPDTDQHI